MEGADGVLVSGCHPGDCHYLTGNLLARRKFILLKRLLSYMGVAEQRVRFAWVSASEGEEFAALITEITEKVRTVGPFRGFLRKDGGEDAATL
jgi:coenzyme F420-reducing hydrogenase delta subunit